MSVVVPTCNEARNLERLLPGIAAVRPAVDEVIVADAGSTDGTGPAAAAVLPGVKVVRQTRSGKGNALACGFAAATGEIIVTLDADGTADPRQIPTLVGALLDGADFATGSRFVAGGEPDGMSGWCRARGVALNALARAFFGAEQTDLGFGYHAFWADLLPVFDLPSIAAPARLGERPWGDGVEIETLLSCRVAAAGARLAEVAAVPGGRRRPPSVADDRRVLRVLTTERRRTRGRSRPTPGGPGRRAGQPPPEAG